jgi:hypothetical protein
MAPASGLLFLECAEGNAPHFTFDPSAQPSQCADIELPTPLITVFDPAFRYPRNLKIALGADARLPWGLVGTVDLLYTRGVNQLAERDLNLLPPSGVRLRRQSPVRGTSSVPAPRS